MNSEIQNTVAQIVGTTCEGVSNPYGSIIVFDLGPLGVRPDDPPGTQPYGWRRLTISSPWRVENSSQIVFDWNVDGGPEGLLRDLLPVFIGQTVVSAETAPPGWDLLVRFSRDLKLLVFGDCNDDRDEAWLILGRDGAKAEACPIVRELGRSNEA